MAIDTWITVTSYNSAAGVAPRGVVQFAGADGGSVTLAYDSAVITTHSQLRDCLRLLSSTALGRLTGP